MSEERTKLAHTAGSEFTCTDCGGDAYVGVSNVRGPFGIIVREDERLCLVCAKKRGCPNFIHSPKKTGK